MQDDTKIVRPRGRPRSFEHGEALARVTAAFKMRGYSATSLDDVARATGLNRPSLYAAFGDKKSMYLRTLDDLHKRLTASFGNLINANLGLEDSLRRLFQNSVEAYLAGEQGPQGCLAVTTASVESVTDKDIRAALDGILQLIDDSITVLFKREGIADPASHGRLTASFLHSLSVRARAGQPRALLQAMGRDAVKQIMLSAAPKKRARSKA